MQRAEMQAAALDQDRHRRDGIERGRGREIEALRIAPRPAHQIVEQQVGDIDQHQAGEDFAGAEAHLAQRRDQRIERAAERAEHQHRRQHPGAGIGAMGDDREPAAAHRADDELAFGADIPDIGEIAERQADRDHHQRRRLHGDFLQREGIGQRLDEIDVERRRPDSCRAARTGSPSSPASARSRAAATAMRDLGRAFGAPLKHQLHAPPPCRFAPTRRPSAGRASRASASAVGIGADRWPWNITAMRSAISASSSRSWLITSTARAARRRDRCSAWRIDGGGAGIDAPGRLADDQHAGLAQDFAADDEFLQVAAGQADRFRVALGLAHVEGLGGRGRPSPASSAVSMKP